MTEQPVALVTGASRGIGRAIALELSKQGCALAINYYDLDTNGQQDDHPATQTKEQIEASGASCILSFGDISQAEYRQQLARQVRDTFGRCDLLVNNAGMAPRQRHDILEATEASYDQVMAVNLKGPYFLTQTIARWMIEQRQNHHDRPLRIVNIASMSSYAASPSRGEYCLSKAGVSMMTSLYAIRLAEHDIGVFELRPGIIATDMTATVKDKYDTLIAQGLTPTRRWGQPEDVARAVGAIAQGRIDFSTGQVLNIDGGFHLRSL